MPTPSDSEEDYEWIQDVLDGNMAAYENLVRKYRSRIYRLVFRFTRHDQELDDLCQEIFIRVYQKLGKYRREAPFEHWLLRVATNFSYSWLRKHRHRHQTEIQMDQLPEMVDLGREKALSRELARDLLEIAFAQMSAEERLIITLLELEEKSVREIAALTGWSESNVKTRAHRARRALAKILESHEDRN